MTHEQIKKEINECYEKNPLGLTIYSEEDRDLILKLAAVFEANEKPLPAKKMMNLLEKTAKIIEYSAIWGDISK